MTGPLSWWRLEMAAPEELEESLLWKLNSLGIPRVAVRHQPDQPRDRRLLAWLPAIPGLASGAAAGAGAGLGAAGRALRPQPAGDQLV
jgi:hypothetical protein